jgi:hypothetical protein
LVLLGSKIITEGFGVSFKLLLNLVTYCDRQEGKGRERGRKAEGVSFASPSFFRGLEVQGMSGI